MTTDDVAEALVTLTAAVAQTGAAEAVRIPIVVEGSGALGEADLVIGVGNDVLSAPATWEGEAPDFSDAADRLKSHHLYPHGGRKSDDDAGDDTVQDLAQAPDFDYDGYIDAL
ncbi:hypothetical protein ABC304_01355 [Microbacterium sp. 1P10UB]|uniref:hypothetical protein n=1 Tax=unclassified Microbacterium TaxID=2609290 RepID=UPI0039A2B067